MTDWFPAPNMLASCKGILRICDMSREILRLFILFYHPWVGINSVHMIQPHSMPSCFHDYTVLFNRNQRKSIRFAILISEIICIEAELVLAYGLL